MHNKDIMSEQILGSRYKVIEILGAGGFSQTYVAEDMQRPGNPRCVVKQFKPAKPNPAVLPVARRLFHTEGQTLERLGKHDQIPRLLAYFEENEEFYLVQELIEGHSLSSELPPGQKQSEAYVINLLQDVLKILEFVHGEGVIHRDIKPSNLIRRASDGKLVLIDFGAVKDIGNQITDEMSDVPTEAMCDRTAMTVAIGTQGYMPREQLAGQPHFNSDIYALGAIAIKALTGINPGDLPYDKNTSEIIWRERATVSDGFAAILDKMVRCYFADRFQSATEVLQALQMLSQTVDSTWIDAPPVDRLRHRQPHGKLLFAGGTIASAAIAFFFWTTSVQPPAKIPETNIISTPETDSSAAQRISFGDRILAFGSDNPAKQEGADFMRTGDYQQAIKAFESVRSADITDPETLIYLNNARIGNGKYYAIAAAVPLGITPDSANEMLRGIAQAQDEINAAGGINGVPLKVAIANDDNHPIIAKSLAQELVKNPEILGVVGHGISDTTLAAGAIYQSGELVAIAPVSSAIQLSELGRYVFRIMPSDRYASRALSTYMSNQLNKQKAVVFYNGNSVYSQSIKNEFKDALFYRGGGKVIGEFDLSRPDFNARKSVETAIKHGADAIVLLPSNDVLDRALQVVYVNRRRLNMLAGDGFYLTKTLEIAGEDAEGMVLAVPGSLIGEKGENFRAKAMQLWGENSTDQTLNNGKNIDNNLLPSERVSVNWRTALTYDATQALIAAIRNNPTRNGVQRSLSASNFSVIGSTGIVSFRPTGDREAAVQLVVVKPTKNGYQFKPLEFGNW
jgi:ABC-type branched-subunit amino acid transport system substrate-binding protein/serine/threonine protein kinase